MNNTLSSLNTAKYYPARMMDLFLRGNELFTQMNVEAIKALEKMNLKPPGSGEYLSELSRIRNRTGMIHLMGQLYSDLLQLKSSDLKNEGNERSVLDKRLEKFRSEARTVYDRFAEQAATENNDWLRKIEDWCDDLTAQWAESISSSNDGSKVMTQTFVAAWKDIFDTPPKSEDKDYSTLDNRLDGFFLKVRENLQAVHTEKVKEQV